jgi:hypothetical protein
VTKLQTILASALLFGSVLKAQAYYEIITTESHIESAGVRYYFVVWGWTTGDNSPNPCASDDPVFTICGIDIVATPPRSTMSVGSYSNSWEVPVRPSSSTLGQLLSDLQRKGFRIPLSGSILVPRQSANNDLCITFRQVTTGPGMGGAYNRFGPCARVAPATVQCDISGNITIDHKSLPDNKLDGAKASTQLNLQCRGTTSVTVSASRTNTYGVRLRDDNSLYSKITVNGKDATTGINVPVNDNVASPLNITSTLISRGTVTPGAFSGSTVITVSPP